MHRALGRTVVKGMPRGLAINCRMPPHWSQMQFLAKGVDPVNKTLPESLGIEIAEHSIERVVRGNPVGQCQNRLEKIGLVQNLPFSGNSPRRGVTSAQRE